MNPGNPEDLLKSVARIKGPAPVHSWNPPYCGEIDMRIAADGRWYHEGSLISRPALVQLFSSILRLDPDGHHYLVTPAERVRIQVDDCPFVAQLLDVEHPGSAEQCLHFTLNTGERVTAGGDNRIEVGEHADGQPHPMLHVRHGLMALISRSVFYQLVDIAQIEPPSDKDCMGDKNPCKTDALMVFSSAEKFLLGRL